MVKGMYIKISPKAIRSSTGFTLIELLIVLSIIALLMTLVLPRYFSSMDRSRDVVLETNLKTVRDMIDQFHADKGRYPDSLQEMVDVRYLKDLPIDPITGSKNTWLIIPPEPPQEGELYDIRSGAKGNSMKGIPYGDL